MVQEIATLGGGCFWCLEAIYDQLIGIEEVVSGYSGGHIDNPTYEQVCGGITGHAEVMQIKYDTSIISFKEILGVFFAFHDPTTLNRQGADVGTQYRSVVFYHTDEQKTITEQAIAKFEAERLWPNPIVTEITPLDIFYPAEDYHQDYFARNPRQGYCSVVIAPKVAKFRKQYLEKLKS
jgi:peptide-methionine (S)-S-oxide reductase